MSRFTEETFPEKWCIEYHEIVHDYFLSNNPGYMYSRPHDWYHSDNLSWGTGWVSHVEPDVDHTIITLNEFKEFVLMEKEFILPEKWAIKDCEKVALFAHEKWGCVKGVRDKYYHHGNNTHNTVDYCFNDRVLIEEGFIVITLDQFIKYVLNQQPQEDHSQLVKLLNDIL